MSLHDWASIHEKEGFTAATPFLALLSFVYGAAVRLRLVIGRKRPKRTLPGAVISVGNLTAGGTGKTPLVCMLAQWAVEEGHRAAVLSRGYGGKNRSMAFIVSDGKNVFAGPDLTGDEPYLICLLYTSPSPRD